jgi:hypothetical protein
VRPWLEESPIPRFEFTFKCCELWTSFIVLDVEMTQVVDYLLPAVLKRQHALNLHTNFVRKTTKYIDVFCDLIMTICI